MKEFKNETMVITKEAYFFLRNENRRKANCLPLSKEQLEKTWLRIRYRNDGANPKTHPIDENEIRISKDSFNFKLEEIKEMLIKNGFSYRQDGFVQEGFYL